MASLSGLRKIQSYLTKTKTVLKLEDNTHKEHQPIPQTSMEYTQGPETSQLPNVVWATIPQDQGNLQKLSTRAQFIGFSSFLLLF